MEEELIDFLYYPHEENIPCDEFIARNPSLYPQY
jgi:hypothetical protein